MNNKHFSQNTFARTKLILIICIVNNVEMNLNLRTNPSLCNLFTAAAMYVSE